MLFVGCVIGGIISREILRAPDDEQRVANLTEQLRDSHADAARLTKEISALKKEVERLNTASALQGNAVAPTAPSIPESHANGKVEMDESATARLNHRIEWRVSAIEKFVPLTEDQKDRLMAKFKAESTDPDSSIAKEELDSIIGEESARVYRDAVRQAFVNARNEEIEKEVLLLSRKLALTPEQESGVRTVYQSVEQEAAAEHEEQGNLTGEERLQKMIARNQERSKRLSELLKPLLTPEQYTAYAQYQSDSPDSDLEVFHSP